MQTETETSELARWPFIHDGREHQLIIYAGGSAAIFRSEDWTDSWAHRSLAARTLGWIFAEGEKDFMTPITVTFELFEKVRSLWQALTHPTPEQEQELELLIQAELKTALAALPAPKSPLPAVPAEPAPRPDAAPV